ncbi:hypothetical protein Tsubulata_418019 [Turnera subulata]|uniref:Fatty acyl-CoA reductase n=1 Tax=Turnera subulata TaxID=218843 RepID=A0A9Q0JNT7_9ROSI|nr:hypothetical protein Tsubulata_418019 [Turnera subulata]
MLRAAPDLGKLYVLVKAKDKAAAMNRLKNEIMDEDLFGCLKDMHGKSYYNFMMDKLVPVLGNVCEDDLGMDPDTTTRLAGEIDVILNSAAFTTFDGSWVWGVKNIIPLCLTHSSSIYCVVGWSKYGNTDHLTYVAGQTEGVSFEKALTMGQSTSPSISAPLVDVDAEIKLASEWNKSLQDGNRKAKKMRDLGIERAKIHGWSNSYEFTKAMGEMQIGRMTGKVPTVIVRPSIIESTYSEPFPGWIQGNRMFEPVILSYGQGHLPCFVGEANTIMDIVPVDMVVNAILAAVAKHGITAKPELHVYNVTSSVENPVALIELWEHFHDHFTLSPLLDSRGKTIRVPPPIFFTELHSFSAYLREKIVGKNGLQENLLAIDPKSLSQIQRECNKIVMRSTYLAEIYKDYVCGKVRFDSGNTRKLLQNMSTQEKMDFGFDIGNINWRHYFVDLHIPSIRRRILKEPFISSPVAASRI